MPINIHNINPYVRVARPSILPAGTGLRRRVIFDYELLYIEQGEFTLNYNDVDFQVLPGSFLLFRPGIPHSFRDLISDVSQPHIHFDLLYSPKSTQTPVCYQDLCDFTPHEHTLMQDDLFHPYPQNPFIHFSNEQEFLDIFYDIVKNNGKESELAQKAKLSLIIDMIISDNFPKSVFRTKSTMNVAHQIKGIFDSEQGLLADLDELENRFAYSKYHMEREFKKTYGISIIAYRNAKRMELAEKLLENNSVSAVSEALGFSSIYAFSRAFKHFFSIPPSQFIAYRQQIKKL